MIEFADSAGKHGISRADVVYAMTTGLKWNRDPFDGGREGHQPPMLFIGLSSAGVMLEVMAERMPPRGLRVFHAMALRPEIAERAGFYL